MTAIDMTPLTDEMLARMAVVHKPTFEYITERRANGVPTKGNPVRPQPAQYRAPRLTKEECAAEYWKTCVDLAFTSRANPDYEHVHKEVTTWYRFATTPPAF